MDGKGQELSTRPGRGLAMLCDAEGTVLDILRDDLDIADRLAPGRPLTLVVDRGSLGKALSFLVDLRARGTAFGWELNVPTTETTSTLLFAGVATEGGLLIVAAESGGGILSLYEELMGINNEQVNALRAALKERASTRLQGARDTAEQPASTLDERPASAYDELSRLNNELANLQRELTKKNAELERLNELKDRFLGIAAHDLRTPLSVILGYSGFLREDLAAALSEEHLRFLSEIRSSSRFMLHLVNRLLDVATIESGRLALDRQPTDLAALVERNVALNGTLAEAKQIRLTCRCDERLPEMMLDGPRIEQVLNNLLSNAVKFSYPESLVEVRLSREGGYAVLSVVDTGQGIPEDRLDDLFQWFARSKVKGTAGETGTGLGLAIAQKIVEGHMGDIWVESELGQGSTFYVSLPITEGRTT
jgi:signal transduction histidine kinase